MSKNKLKTVGRSLAAVLILTLLSSVFAVLPGVAQAQGVNGLHKNIVIGYWHNFDNNQTVVYPLREVKLTYDIINVSFMETTGGFSTAIFEPSEEVYGKGRTLADRDAEFISDMEYLKSKGKFVVISLGGQNGHLELTSDSDKTVFLESAWSLMKKYGFDGIDIDLEGSSMKMNANDSITNPSTPFQKNLIDVSHELARRFKAEYGRDMILTAAPEHNYVQGGTEGMATPWGAYLPYLHGVRDILTCVFPQYYNNGISYTYWDGKSYPYGSVDAVLACSEMLLLGFTTSDGQKVQPFRPDQVAIGVPCSSGAAGSGQVDNAQLAEGLKYMITGELGGYTGSYRLKNTEGYLDFRGVMTWSTNWDDTRNGGSFGQQMHEAFVSVGGQTPPFTFTSITASVSGYAETGTEITWTANVSGGDSPKYQFTVYKDGISVHTQLLGTSDTFKYTPASKGAYYVIATVKSGVSSLEKQSETILVSEPFILEPLVIDKVEGSITQGVVTIGERITVTVGASGGAGVKNYSYYLLSDGRVHYSGDRLPDAGFSYTPYRPGNYKLLVFVTDGYGAKTSCIYDFQVAAPPANY